MIAMYWQAPSTDEDETVASDDTVVADADTATDGESTDSISQSADAHADSDDVADESADVTAAEDTVEVILLQDGAESLGGIAETIHESTVGETTEDIDGAQFLGVSGLEWSLGIGSLLVALVLRHVIMMVLTRFIQPIVDRTESEYDDKVLLALRRALSSLALLAGFFLAFTFIPLPHEPFDWQAGIWRVLNTLIVVNIGVLVYRIVEIFLHFIAHAEDKKGRSVLDEQFFPLLRDVTKFIIALMVTVTIVQNWGYSASGLLTGVGIGGLAMAFAAQDTVANIFGSFVIYSDRPYRVGDWIKIGGVEGTVEEIGIRCTRVRKFDKTLVFMPNKTVTTESIQNFSEMPVRRIKVYVGLSYDASTEQIKEVIQRTRDMLRDHPEISQKFWMVNFTEMSASTLDMLVYCFTETTVWKEYMDIRQDVLLKIIDICAEVGVEIAFPSRTIYHRTPEVHPMAGVPDNIKRSMQDDMPDEYRRDPGAGSTRGAEFDVDESDGGEG